MSDRPNPFLSPEYQQRFADSLVLEYIVPLKLLDPRDAKLGSDLPLEGGRGDVRDDGETPLDDKNSLS